MTYEVEAKCGHVGKRFYLIKFIPVIADSKKEAARLVRSMPRVKHNHPDAIRGVREIDHETFLKRLAEHNADPYFHCRSRQEQQQKCPNLILFPEPRYQESEEPETSEESYSRLPLCRGKMRIRNPRKFIRMYEEENGGFAS